MFERIGRAAERAASEAGQSRRGFLGVLGRRAVVAAGAACGVLAAARPARARPHCYDCGYTCGDGSTYSFFGSDGGCPKPQPGCRLTWKSGPHSCY